MAEKMTFDCEWLQPYFNRGTELRNVNPKFVKDHIFRLSVWASQTSPELLEMREAYPAVSEERLKWVAVQVVCNLCFSFMPAPNVKYLRRRIAEGFAKCVRERDAEVLENVTTGEAIQGIPIQNSPCRESVISGELLLKQHALELQPEELGPHRQDVECVAEIPLLPGLRVSPMFSRAYDFRKLCTAALVPGVLQSLTWCRGLHNLATCYTLAPGMRQSVPWCRGLHHDVVEYDLHNDLSLKPWWLEQLEEVGGLLDLDPVNPGLVRVSSVSIDFEVGNSYLGLFRIRDAAFSHASILRCSCGSWPNCFFTKGCTTWFKTAWRDATEHHQWLGRQMFRSWYHPSDAWNVCCKEVSRYAFLCPSKYILSGTCSLLTLRDRQSDFVLEYESCLRRQLAIFSRFNTSLWWATVSKSISKCCRERKPRWEAYRVIAINEKHGKESPMCLTAKTGINCTGRRFDQLLHTWRPWGKAFFHSQFEHLPTIFGFRDLLGDSKNLDVRATGTNHMRAPFYLHSGAPVEVLHKLGLELQRFKEVDVAFVKELLVAFIMPATRITMAPAQLLVPVRALLCTSSVRDPSKNAYELDGHSYGSAFDLALQNPSACAKLSEHSDISGKCYTKRFNAHTHEYGGILRVLLAEHGGGISERAWQPSKHIIHEAIERLPFLLAPELLPATIVVADVIVGLLPTDTQRRTFSEAHVVIGSLGSQLCNAICMQPGSYLGAIDKITYTDMFVWNLVSPFGIQYWPLIASNPVNRMNSHSELGTLTSEDEASLRIFIETALTGAASVLAH